MAWRDTVTVKIGTMTYQLQADGNETYVQETAAIADDLIQQSAGRYPGLNQLTNTVLALLNAIDAMRRAIAEKEQAVALLDEQKALAEKTNADLSRVNDQFWEMKKDLLYYRNLCDVYEQKLVGLQPVAEEDKKTIRKKLSLDDLQQSFDDVSQSD